MQTTVELVRFSLVNGSTKSDFLVSNREVEAWVTQQPGFISRQLCLSEEGIWSDIVLWDSKENAKLAADLCMTQLGDSDFMRMIDFSSVLMSHQSLLAHC